MGHLGLSREELALQYRRTPINARLIPDQFLPFAHYLAETGQRPHALALARDELFASLRAQQPSQVIFQPVDRAFNGIGTLRFRYH